MNEPAGVFPAIITPMDNDGRFNEAAFRAVLEDNIQAGAHGFWIAGGTGESVYLDDAENVAIARAAVEQAAGRVCNIMHVGAPSTRRAIALAEQAAAAGMEYLCCVPPFFYEVTEAAIVEHYRAVGAATGLPLFVYNLPQFTGVEITPALMARIKDAVPQLVGLKHSGPTVHDVHAFSQMELACFIGNAYLMLPALTIGAAGCIDGPLNIAPRLWVDIWDAWQANDLQAAVAAQEKASALADAVLEFSFPGCVKTALSLRLGIDCGEPRPPLPAMDQEQTQRLSAIMRALNLMG